MARTSSGASVWLPVLMLVALAIILWMFLGGDSTTTTTASLNKGGQPLHAAVLASSPA